ncbi:hypothetical protein GCK72_014393 [Caenorhabditis remanei]|uniref:Leishmanolysin-like peptidase n=1 Tax=Caenorhabditis remanei TaxID=31234 RepID=A0A6A5GTY6_CAERE|nr:hypothetical protein GCK72_014393 [Caenorhabditis remanei]KAF1757935.1 hypothetical protein GCK72_014393 [Caenorhabditis remanei]
MQIRCLLLLILLVSAISCSPRRGIRVVAVNKDGLFPDRVQSSLESALKWFENAVLVHDSFSDYVVDYVGKFVPGYQNPFAGRVTIQTPNKAFSLEILSDEFKTFFEYSDVVVFIRAKPFGCGSQPQAFGGSMRPKSPRLRASIPKLAFMEYCYNEVSDTFSYFDLFRHEILHSLGYGVFEPHDSSMSVKEEKYQWKNEDGTESTATRHFFNTNQPALDEVKKYFGCDNDILKGVESDEGGMHLNEYIFQNELMTPTLAEKNYFSYISAAILENIYTGNEQWYNVNRTFIGPEADAYNFGKGFGCSWLLNSCYEFLEERKNEKVPRPAPFCLEDSVQKCFKKSENELIAFSCELRDSGAADNNIPRPLNTKYNVPSTRYCPIYPNYFEKSKYELVDCQHHK